VSELFISRPLSTEKIGVTAASVASTVATSPSFVRVITDRNAHVRIGSDASGATVDDMLIYAFHPVFFNIASGESIKLIRKTGEVDGEAWITLLSQG